MIRVRHLQVDHKAEIRVRRLQVDHNAGTFFRKLISDGNRKFLGHDRNSSLRFCFCERHSTLKNTDVHPFETDTKGRHS